MITGHSSFLQRGLSREQFSQIMTEPEYIMTNKNNGCTLVGYYNDYYAFDEKDLLKSIACKFDKYKVSDTKNRYTLFADYEEWKNTAPSDMIDFLQRHKLNTRLLTSLPYDDDELITIGLDLTKEIHHHRKHIIIAYTRESQKMINIQIGI